MKYICFIFDWQERFNTHEWNEYGSDLRCKSCGSRAAWIDEASDEKRYLIEKIGYYLTCNEIIMKGVIE